MMLSWMAYASVVALLLGAAAAALEPVVRQRGWGVRGLWGGAMLGSLGVPAVAALLLPRIGPWSAASSAGVMTLPMERGAAGWLDPLSAVPTSGGLDPLLVGLWLAASAVVVAVVGASHAALRRRARDWRRGRVDGQEVWISEETGPAVVGVLRGRIVLPAWILERSPADRALVLAHESEHLRAGDPRLMLASLLVVAALPWNVGLWWQWRRLRQAVEVDCDLRVLRRGLDARAYGRLLVEVGARGPAHRLAVAALTESPSLLERRIRLMLTPRSRGWWLRAAGAAAIATLCVLVACRADLPGGSSVPGTGPALGEVVVPAAPVNFAYELSVLEELPRLTNAPDIAGVMERLYPPLLQTAGIGGTVVLQFVITADGAVDPASLQVLNDDARPELAEATKVVSRSFAFRPGVYQGEPVRTLIQMPVTWQPRSVPTANNGAARPATGAQAETAAAPSVAPDQGEVYELSQLSRVPRLSNAGDVAAAMEALYPPELQEAGIGGTAVLEFVILANGAADPESIRVLESSHEALAVASRRAVLAFRFRPGQYQARNVATRIQMPITWQPKG